MSKIYRSFIYLFIMFFTTAIYSQVYVSPYSFVFVNDRILYVKQDINLQNNANIYLRNEAQLLQATTNGSANQGLGKLSLFQEGTVNNYAYNYWCSPTGNASAAVGNESFGIVMLNRPTATISSTAATILSSTALDGVASNLSIAPRWIYKFLSSTLYSQWIAVGSAATINPGEGFTMKGTSGTDAAFSDAGVNNNPGSAQRYDFQGKPNDGNISITLGAGKRTLSGNPYSSAIDLQAFLIAATNSTGIAYFWEQDKTVNSHYITAYKGGYGSYASGTNTYTPSIFYAYDGAGTQLGSFGSGGNYPRKFAPVGQGFMLEGATSGIVTMKNIYRVYQKEGGLSHFERIGINPIIAGFLPAIQSVSGFDYTTVSTAANPQIRFNTMMDNQGIRQAALTFSSSATDGVDRTMDAKSPDGAPTDMYFVIDNNEYVIAAVAFDINKKIPVGFKNAAAANFKITVNEIINFSSATNIFIHDKDNDTYFDIKNGVYEVTLPAGTANNRFEITFINALLNVPALAADSFDVFQNNDSHILTIDNPHLIDVKSVSLYNVSGELIVNKTKLNIKDNYQFSTFGISDGVYIAKIVTEDNHDFAKKISVISFK